MIRSTIQAITIAVFTVFSANFALRANAMEPTPAAKLVSKKGVLVIAHRGNSKYAPENTLPSFAEAVRAGADLVELDYYHSADAVPIVFHDKDLDRTTNAVRVFGRKKIRIGSKKLADLKRLDAGSWFNGKFSGTTIPTLVEALDVIQDGSTTLIEHKGGEASACVELLKQRNQLGQVVVQSFDWDYVSECHKLAPQLTLAALGSKELTEKRLDQIGKTGARVVAWNHKEIGRRQIEAIHRRGWKAWVYTVNDRRRAEQLIADGIDGLISDDPAMILEIVGQQRK